jgi:hypothetical protein
MRYDASCYKYRNLNPRNKRREYEISVLHTCAMHLHALSFNLHAVTDFKLDNIKTISYCYAIVTLSTLSSLKRGLGHRVVEVQLFYVT